MAKSAVITGATGQDGYWLSKYLLGLGYEVVGVVRRTSGDRVVPLGVTGAHGDVTDQGSIQAVVARHKPDEFYHLAAQTHVGLSWKYPTATAEITGVGTLNCLEAVRLAMPGCKFYFAGSSEQFGNVGGTLDEKSAMHPESPYAAAKVFGYNMAHVYRKSYGMFVACGILFNHESEMRGREFVTRKITSELALHGKVSLGNVNARRDWGYAPDYVKAMHLMLQHSEPDDFVVATGKSHSVFDFYREACAYLKLDPDDCLDIDEGQERPADVHCLKGDASKAREILGWEPKVDFTGLVARMCRWDRDNIPS